MTFIKKREKRGSKKEWSNILQAIYLVSSNKIYSYFTE